MKTAKEIEDGLKNFFGTEAYHRLYPNILITDGVKWLYVNAGCGWLLDIIWSYQSQCKKDPMLRCMQFWTLTVNDDKTATVICERDTGNLAIRQEITFTDFPLKEMKLWVQESGGSYIVLLPSEY